MAVLPKFLEGAAFGVLNDVLSEFRSNEGYATPNRYEVAISRPAPSFTGTSQNQSRGLVDQVPLRDMRQISLRAESVTLPGRNLNTSSDTNIYGPKREVVDGVGYADTIDFTFQASSDLKERVMFEKWQMKMFNPQTWNLGYYNDYIGVIEVYLLDKNSQRTFGLRLHECYPKSIGQQQLGYAMNDALMILPVSMSFRYWTTADTNQEAPSLSDKIGQTISNAVERNLNRALPAVLRKL